MPTDDTRRAEADVAALHMACQYALWWHQGDDSITPDDVREKLRQAVLAAHPGAPLLAALHVARAALKPFARVAARFPIGSYPQSFDVSSVGELFTLREIRTARAALAQLDAAGIGTEAPHG